MSDFNHLTLPRIDLYDGGPNDFRNESRGFINESMLDGDEKEDPNLCAEAVITEGLERVKSGSIPGLTIDRRIIRRVLGVPISTTLDILCRDNEFGRSMYSAEGSAIDPELTLEHHIVTGCFRAVNRLFGRAPNGRDLLSFDNIASDQGNGIFHDGYAHVDGVNGITIHVQRGQRVREVSMGFRRDTEPTNGTTGFTSVEAGATEDTIWHGKVRPGDLTLLNSGLVLPDHSILSAVHRFRMLNQSPNSTTAFSQFTERFDFQAPIENRA